MCHFVETDGGRIVKSTVPVCARVGKGHLEPGSERIVASETLGQVGIDRSISREKVGRNLRCSRVIRYSISM